MLDSSTSFETVLARRLLARAAEIEAQAEVKRIYSATLVKFDFRGRGGRTGR